MIGRRLTACASSDATTTGARLTTGGACVTGGGLPGEAGFLWARNPHPLRGAVVETRVVETAGLAGAGSENGAPTTVQMGPVFTSGSVRWCVAGVRDEPALKSKAIKIIATASTVGPQSTRSVGRARR